MRLLLDHHGNGHYNNDYNVWDDHRHSYYHTDGVLNTWVVVLIFVFFFLLLLFPLGLCIWPDDYYGRASQKKNNKRPVREVDYINN